MRFFFTLFVTLEDVVIHEVIDVQSIIVDPQSSEVVVGKVHGVDIHQSGVSAAVGRG